MGWKRGSVVLEAKPYAHVICLKFREERCNFCLVSAENMKCGSCKKIWYCGIPCQKQDWKVHKVECQIMKQVPDTPTDSLRLYLRLIIRYLAGAASIQHPEDESPCLRTFNDLMSHADNIRVDPTRSKQFRIATDFLRAYADGILRLPGDDVLLDIFGKMVINSFMITDEKLENIGVAVYTSPSTFDHRCSHNAIPTFNGRKMIIRALDDIMSDSLSDVFLCYVETLATTAERNEQLEQQYYFTCNCDQCQNEKMDSMILSVEGSSEGELKMVKDCLEKIERMRKEQAEPKAILVECQQCINKVRLPRGNVFLVRLMEKAMDAAIGAEAWEIARVLSIKNYEPYLIFHHQFNPYLGWFLVKTGTISMYLGRLSEALDHLTKALENFTVSLGESHYLYKLVRDMMAQCEAEMGSQVQGGGVVSRPV